MVVAEQTGGDDVRINVEGLTSELEKLMSGHNLSMSPRCCIFKVPNILLRHYPKAYIPNAFSIGPFHYSMEGLKATQKIKLRYLRDLISRLSYTHPEMKLKDLTRAISELQGKARECYAGGFDMSTDEFVKVLLLDGCFLIELFRKARYWNLREKDDPIFTMSCLHEYLDHDLILLENQIPWLVLECLFNMTMTPSEVPLKVLALEFFHEIFSRSLSTDENALRAVLSTEHSNKHILDLLRNSMVLTYSVAKDNDWNSTSNWQRMPSATTLREAGIKFKKATSKASILDIKFEDGVLEIPQLNCTFMRRRSLCFET